MTLLTGPLVDLVVRMSDPPDPADAYGRIVASTVSATLARLGATTTNSTSSTSSTKCDVTVRPRQGDSQSGAVPFNSEPLASMIGSGDAFVGEVDGLPEGTMAYATGLALAGATILAALADTSVDVDPRGVANHVLLPMAMAASYGTEHRQPSEPTPIGDGFVACDFAGPEDGATFARLLQSLGTDAADPVAVADEAQRWRLPVCAFVEDPGVAPTPHGIPQTEWSNVWQPGSPPLTGSRQAPSWIPNHGAAPLSGLVVCDLTAMWAGPLTTWLLASLGADVRKIEPAVRLDGMRASDGSGIHPPHVDASGGDASAMFNALNRGKQIIDVDLRDSADRARFESIVAVSDVVIDNFSRRVMPNLGYPPAQLASMRPGIITVSMSAFPATHPWQVALGAGIHAAAGLGWGDDGTVATPTVAYPDPLAGLTAFVETLAALWAGVRRTPRRAQHRDIAMLDVVTPLRAFRTAERRVARRDPTLGARLLDHPKMGGAWEQVADGAGVHRYPRSPFVGTWPAVALTPAARHPTTRLADASRRRVTVEQR